MKSSLEKLNRIRGLMNERGIDVYVIPLNDPHLGEYIPDHWRIIEWLTGFSGSAATVVITDLLAGLWTDSRYYIQADSQLIGSGCTFMKQSLSLIHISEPTRLGMISYAVFCLKKKKKNK